MNFLAHIFLSGDDKDVQIGNFIGDVVKGNKYNNYPDKIKEGILLHRKIDDFTDNNETVKQAVERLKPKYNRYSAIVVDILFDYFLIKNWDKYSNKDFNAFVKEFHINLMCNYLKIPAKARVIVVSIVVNRWFHRYSTKDGIKEVLDKMAFYRNIPDESDFAIEILIKYEADFDKEFNIFFPKLIEEIR
jgi:acyl carrier protein phosphodiesterase